MEMDKTNHGFIVYSDFREGYVMGGGGFWKFPERGKVFDKEANARRSAWHYDAQVLEIDIVTGKVIRIL